MEPNNSNTPGHEIRVIAEKFGLKYKFLAEAMKVTHETIRKKMSDKSQDHSFNEKNLKDLKDYIRNLCLTLDILK